MRTGQSLKLRATIASVSVAATLGSLIAVEHPVHAQTVEKKLPSLESKPTAKKRAVESPGSDDLKDVDLRKMHGKQQKKDAVESGIQKKQHEQIKTTIQNKGG